MNDREKDEEILVTYFTKVPERASNDYSKAQEIWK